MFWLQFISKFIRAIRSGRETPGQVAAGFTFGYLIGLMPFFSLQTIALALLLFLLNINLAAATAAVFLAGLLAYVLDPAIHALGYMLLVKVQLLHALWETLYNLPVAPLTKFYNTVALGSLVAGLATAGPVYWGMKKFIIAYRAGFEEKVNKWKLVRVLRGSALYRWIEKLQRLGDLP